MGHFRQPKIRSLRSAKQGQGAGNKNQQFQEKTLVNGPSVAVYASAEMWPSGRRRSPAKGVNVNAFRGFESLRLCHFIVCNNSGLQAHDKCL